MLGGFSSKNGPASFAFPSTSSPRTLNEWKVAVRRVKELYFKRQYKQCAAQCVKLLTAKDQVPALCKVYLSMYAAISYEFLGHSAHLFSSNKISFLTQALDHFVDADAALPAPVPLPRLPKVEDESCPDTPVSSAGSTDLPESPRTAMPPESDSMVQGIMHMIDSALINLDDDPFFSDDETDYQQPFARALMDLASGPTIQPPSQTPTAIHDPVKKESLVPPPLHLNRVTKHKTLQAKAAGKLTLIDDGPCNVTGRYRPPRLPLKIIPTNRLNVNPNVPAVESNKPASATPHFPRPLPELPGPTPTTDPIKETQAPTYWEGVDPVRAARIVWSNRGIALLHQLIATNINEIHRHIDQVTEIQHARRARKMQRAASFWSFRPVESNEPTVASEPEPTLDEFGNILVKESLPQRIARLRAEGWNTVGLRSPRSTWKGARYYQEFCAMVLNELHLDG